MYDSCNAFKRHKKTKVQNESFKTELLVTRNKLCESYVIQKNLKKQNTLSFKFKAVINITLDDM